MGTEVVEERVETEKAFMHDVRVDKISLVDHPANNREFLIFKSVHGASEGAKNKDKSKKEKKMPKEIKKELKDVLKEKGLSSELSEEHVDSIVALLEDEDVRKAIAGNGDQDKEELEKKELKKKEDEEKEKKGLEKANGDKPSSPEMILLVKSVENLEKSNKQLSEELAEEKSIRKDEEFLQKASRFPFVPVEKSKIAGVLRFLSESNEGHATELEKMLVAVNKTMRTASVFKEVGKTGSSSVIASAGDSIIQKAQERIAKGAAKDQSLDEVVADIIRENPELYQDHIDTFSPVETDFTEQ